MKIWDCAATVKTHLRSFELWRASRELPKTLPYFTSPERGDGGSFVNPESSRPQSLDLFKSDFNLEFYNPDTVTAGEVETHVKAFFGEKLLMPRREELWIGQDGVLDPDYVAMMQRSIQFWRERGDNKAVERFEHELQGARNAVDLILASAVGSDNPLPIVINASDPGEFYVDKDGRKKSVTFVWILQDTKERGWTYKVFSLPSNHIGLEKHWEIVRHLADIQRTEHILKRTLTNPSSEELIAFPVILDQLTHTLDEVAHKLDYESWNQIEKKADDQLALENDPYAPERRDEIVTKFMMRIFFAVKDRRSKEYKEALVEAMSDTMALEAGNEYPRWHAKQMEREIDKNVRLALAIKYGAFEKKNYQEVQSLGIRLGDLRELFQQYGRNQFAFEYNPLAREARSTGCGGSGTNYSLNLGFDMIRSYGLDTTYGRMYGLFEDQRDNYPSTILDIDTSSSDSEEPEGRYAEATYRPGHCRACNKDRKKVWHKTDGGCDCCTTCEHRLAGSTD